MESQTFRTSRALRTANSVALGASLAAITGAVLGGFLGGFLDSRPQTTIPIVLSTLVIGTVWAEMLRSNKTYRVAGRTVQAGWFWSFFLAPLNAALACGALFSLQSGPTGFIIGAVCGATFGAVFWVPALLLTLLGFAFPMRRAQKLAARGLAGEEQGELIAGRFCAALGLVGAATALAQSSSPTTKAALLLTAALAVITGVTGSSLAQARSKRRAKFLGEVARGDVPGYRVQDVAEGRVLLRVQSKGDVYRGGEDFEALYELDAELEAEAAEEENAAKGGMQAR